MNNKKIRRIDCVGSFLPPERLIAAHSQYSMGVIDYMHLRIIEDYTIENLVEREIEMGLADVTSGEFRRNQWDKDFWYGFKGIRCERVESGRVYQPIDPFTDLMRFIGRISYNPEHPFFDDFAFLSKVVNGRANCRQTIPSPANLYLEMLAMTDGYPELMCGGADNLLSDIANAYNKTIMHFYEIGCRHLQIDDTACGLLCETNYTKRLLQGGVDLIALHEQIIGLLNQAIADIPTEMELSIYLSGGDIIVPEWEYLTFPDNIMPKVLSRVNVNKFFMPFDVNNPYQFEVLQHVPEGKKVVLGLADAHSPYSESAHDIIHACDIVAKYISPCHLSVSPKTGFKLSSYASRGLTYEYQWQKLAQLKAVLSTITL
ncbi:MAG: hypothetical protein ACI308_03685 [Muribaculaceae bacterium]